VALAGLAAASPALARLDVGGVIPLPVPRPSFPSDPVEVPLPPRRPSQAPASLPPPPPAAPPAPAVTQVPASSPGSEAVCDALMRNGTVRATRLAPIAGTDGCGIADPVELSAIKTQAGTTVEIAPPVRLRCELAQALADWTRDDLLSITAAKGELRRIVSADAYECRGRNRVVGAKLSEHGKGNAVDIVALAFAGAPPLTLTARDAGPEVAAIKASACRRFATVLGPGSDGYHESHIHLDLEDRGNGGHLCEWDLPTPPTPSP
jgi:hypothetical protein